MVDVFVCEANCQDCRDHDIRLVGGTADFEGRVEICSSGMWGTICSNGWDQQDTSVACRQITGTRFSGPLPPGSMNHSTKKYP